MVYMSSSALDWCPILKAWLLKRNPNERALILELFTNSFPEIYRYSIQYLNNKMDTLEAFVIRQACDLLEGLIPRKDEKDTSQVDIFVMVMVMPITLKFLDFEELLRTTLCICIDVECWIFVGIGR